MSRGWPRAIEPPEEAQLPPRYAPCAELPAYRYVPGLFPHPTAHSDGHGVDLFNRRYYWEAHEAWEAFWHACDKARTQGLFIQGLIQISAALLRWHMGTERGVRKLYGEGRAKLERAAGESPADYMGLAVAAWLGELNRIFEQLLSALETDDLDPEFPLIRLQL